ncbi:LysR family transcriptional regulator [Acetobacter sp.]|uniref:LysR family transcriptional regulator n=1 Tax=Acetobacter sp. TaxID=440 RepID=UPI0025C28E90|nr:LysR family transcriptional regulator [Acetobacter sp.]MCH4092009.1 LysR family transcriptional regulator [Acetobacter sp.]MCI1300737.1 LysR family transcriptional regulator [Acetobacter sp.]MCI1317511.1 LysR family transcriptional regulator [Acetobacter sp.]
MKLSSFDLNLLVVFDAVLRERSVTKGAEQLGLSQPATSHALNRLRQLMKDKLLIRTPSGMTPTPRAEELARHLHQTLIALQGLLQPDVFEPATSQHNFRVAMNNYAAVVLAGPVVLECAASAPGVTLSLLPSGTLDLPGLLDRGDLDLVVSDRPIIGDRFSHQTLLEDHYVVAMRRGHPVSPKKLDMRTFASLPHLVISSSGEDMRFVDIEMENRGYVRHVAAEAPFLSAGTLLVQSQMVAVLGRQIAQEFQNNYPIELAELPFKSPSLHSVMTWHKRLEDQPAHCWLRKYVVSVAENL